MDENERYNVTTIRQLLHAAFTTDTLRRFCEDRAQFRGLMHEFSPAHGLSEMVDRVIVYCRTCWLWDELLTEVRREYPRQYERFEDKLALDGPSSDRSDRLELAYLRRQVTSADEFLTTELYVDVAASADSTETEVEARSEAARLVLERQLRAFKDQRHARKDNRSGSQSIDSFDSLHTYVREAQHVALIGDPGSGKTTTLHQLRRRLAVVAAEHSSEPLPLFVSLGRYAGDSFDAFLASHLDRYGLKLRDYLPGRVFLLLDGLNEMSDLRAAQLQRWLNDNPRTPAVVTCRKLDYFRFRLPLNRVDIEPLDVARIHEFLERFLVSQDAHRLFWQLAGKEAADAWHWWGTARTPSALSATAPVEGDPFHRFWYGKIPSANAWETGKVQVKRIQDDLRLHGRLPGLLGIAANPFFLTAIVYLYGGAATLYQNRGQLIGEFVDLLATRATDTASSASLIAKPADTLRSALSVLAYQMQAGHTGTTVDVAWVVKTLATELPEVDVKDILGRSASVNILDVVPHATVRFTHQLLQEYFAALQLDEAILRGAEAKDYWPGTSWWTPTGWEESAVLLAGIREDATALVEWLMPVQPTLAFRCAAESGAVCDSRTLQALYEPPPGVRVSPEARFEWGKKLAVQGDHRRGVGLRPDGLPDIDWCTVPEGEFLFGRRRARRTLPAFRIARYPVTYVQFQAFADAPDGYQDSTWWHGLPVPGRHVRPQEFKYGNHPRDNVSWYDAIAFCRWLGARLGQAITLPTEQQWEKAARGTDGRAWPWGDQYQIGYANVDERDDHNPVGPTYFRSTTAVGLYPWGQSPYGVMDMCGNVWEWCLNDASDVDGTAMGDPAAPKQLRGGSWNNNIDVAPTYHRYTDWVSRPILPAYRNWRVGFRVVALD